VAWSGVCKFLRADQKKRIKAALEKGLFGILAGDYVTYVDADGKEYKDLLCICHNLVAEGRRQGIIVDHSGIREQGILEILFSKDRLASARVNIEPDGYFIIDGERYDFAKGEEIQDRVNSVGGIHNLLIVRVRRAAELIHSAKTSDWDFDLS
jgi:hypothetical protein